ncbi:MAG TPA: diacylglycerol kinase family protein [Sediminibacterium sp.]|nr:diacylglycerol kinase family protein [Sediminibacterium sp.]
MNKYSNRYSSRFFRAFVYAGRGLLHFIRHDRNGKLHLFAALLVTIGGFYFQIPVAQWTTLLLCFGLVIGLEMCNHALESLCDLVQPEPHPLIKIAKDVAAGAVLWAAIISLVIGLLIFIPYLT